MNKITRGNSKRDHRSHYYSGININVTKGECNHGVDMLSRINNAIIIIKCPDTCEFFEKCIAKSGEKRNKFNCANRCDDANSCYKGDCDNCQSYEALK